MSETAIGQLIAGHGPAATSARRPTVAARVVPGTLLWHALPWVLPVALFGLWLAGSARGWIAPQILPPPSQVFATLADLARSGDLAHNVEDSLRRVIIGFAGGSVLGLVLGSAFGLSRTLQTYLLPSFNALVQIPVLGWLPFLMLLIGIGEPLQYVMIGQASLVPVTLSALQGFRQVPLAYCEVAGVFQYKRWQLITEVIFPAALPTLATGVRLAFTKAWLALVVVEMVASSAGLGYLIVYGRQLFQLDLVMAAVIVVGAIGYVIDRLLNCLEARLTRGQAPAF